MSVERLAEAADMHRRSIIQIEAGRVSARISTLHTIAHALGVPLPQLVKPVCGRHPRSVAASDTAKRDQPADSDPTDEKSTN